MSNTYLDINHDVFILMISKLTDVNDISSISEIILIKNSDYMKLCSLYHPNLFPIKFIYGDTIERYNWSNLYFNFLNEDSYTYNIVTGKVYDKENVNMNLEILTFLFLIGKLPLIKTRKYIQDMFVVSGASSRFYESYNYITSGVLPYIFDKLFENDRYLHIQGAPKVISSCELQDEDLQTLFIKFIDEYDGIAECLYSSRKILPETRQKIKSILIKLDERKS